MRMMSPHEIHGFIRGLGSIAQLSPISTDLHCPDTCTSLFIEWRTDQKGRARFSLREVDQEWREKLDVYSKTERLRLLRIFNGACMGNTVGGWLWFWGWGLQFVAAMLDVPGKYILIPPALGIACILAAFGLGQLMGEPKWRDKPPKEL